MFAVLLAALTLAVAQAAPTDAYRIGPYDVLEIVVPEERPDAPMVMTEALTVGPDGIIGVAYLGSIVAEGKTTAELSEEIRMGLIEAGQFVNPHVLVRVQEYGADRVSVLGAVAEPGYFPFREGLAVRDAVAMANGVLMGIAANTTARVVHRDGTSASFKLNEALRGEGAMADFILQPGDALIVEESAPASVLGYVHSPGDLRVREGARLSEVISLAGGIVESGELTYQSGRTPGDSSRITINRADGTTETVSLMGPDEGTTRDDPPVFPGDVIYVPASRSEVTVLGYVMGPGVLVFRSGDRVSDAIAKAGGVVVSTGVPDNVMEIGDLSAIRLYRADGTEQLVDLDSRVAGTGDPELLPGDSIVVPRREQTYYALGHVRTQGRHVLPPGSRVLDLYTAAGGAMTADALPMRTTDADLANCVLARADGTQLVVDLQAIAQNPALEANVELVHGDSLWVPEADRRVIVAGYVQSPGYFQFREGDTVREVIAMAGGPTISPADSYMNDGDPRNVLIIHQDGAQETIDTTVEDLPVRPGDEIRVPYARQRVTVLGYVVRPGFVLWHEGDTVLDMIAAAGGVNTDDGDRFSAVLIRRGPEGPQFTRVDLSGAHDMDDVAFNVEVLPNDIVMVPRSDHTDWGDWLTNIRNALSITNLIGALF
ncbi:MAG: SLBB domain-containing protein [Armatimonadetes bacterium]|nr:SLBB domain-containing protein [Armatimonadota bacterium]